MVSLDPPVAPSAPFYRARILDLDGQGTLEIVSLTDTTIVAFDPAGGELIDEVSFEEFNALGLDFPRAGQGIWGIDERPDSPALVLFPFAEGAFGTPIIHPVPGGVASFGVSANDEPLEGAIAWVESTSPPQLVVAQGDAAALTEVVRLDLPAGSWSTIRFGDFDGDSRADLGLFRYRPEPNFESTLFVLDVEGSADLAYGGEVTTRQDLWRPSPVGEYTRVSSSGLQALVLEPPDLGLFAPTLEFPAAPPDMQFGDSAGHGLTADGTIWIVGREHGLFDGLSLQPWVQRVATDNTLEFENILPLGSACPPGSEPSDARILAAGAGAITAAGRDEFLVWEETCDEGRRMWAVVED